MDCHFKGDTFDAVLLTFPFDITGFGFLMQFRENIASTTTPLYQWSTEDDSFEIIDAVNGKLLMNKRIIDVKPATYYSDLQITYPNGDIKTGFKAKQVIIQDSSK